MTAKSIARYVALGILLLCCVPALHAGPAHAVYCNRTYGLRIDLPPSWRGFTVLLAPSQGTEANRGELAADRYTVITLRHPLWTAASPREDLPILIFTPEQWARVQNETLFVSAAPIPPSEVAHNRAYIFALPPRWEFDDLPGLDELQSILARKPFRTFQPKSAASQNKAQ